MLDKIHRSLYHNVAQQLTQSPAVAILGPRQSGKTTLAKQLVSTSEAAVYLDLENPADLVKLDDPVAYFALHEDKLICLDEIQRIPDLFTTLRSAIDNRDRNGHFLILGSASPELIRQSSETLAGRIAYRHLTPFLLTELKPQQMRELWLRGGFPRSFLAPTIEASDDWRRDFIRTFLEQDLGMLGFRLPPVRLGRFWRMCAHAHGSLANYSKLANSLDVSSPTIRSYLDVLQHTFMIRTLEPYAANVKKRLIKSPKVYIRDSGVLHTLLGIRTHDELLSHPGRGGSFEGFVIENTLAFANRCQASFYRTRAGAEIDLVLERGQHTIAIEIKASTAPRTSKGFRNALEDVAPDEAFIVAPIDDSFPIKGGITATGLNLLIRRLHDTGFF
ncbi:MAG: ATP-binding protein [Myxococcota bacterium]|nr:ATP-binding protein [Myxococcota bacterium]